MDYGVMARGLIADGHPDLSQEVALSIVKSQKRCIVCGLGLIVQPWGAVVPQEQRIILDTITKRGIPIHGFCLTEPSAGRRISDALGLTEPEA